MNALQKKMRKMHEARVKQITKLLPYLRKHGIQGIKMEEIAKVMEVSRATLYKYFATKDEIVDFIVKGFTEYMNEVALPAPKNDQEFVLQFQQLFEQSISIAIYFSETFLKDLERNYPVSHDQLSTALNRREQYILAFYKNGKKRGIFNDINGYLLIMQDEILKNVLNAKFLIHSQLSIEQALYDYYRLKKIQLFQNENHKLLDDATMRPRIEHLAEKINKNIFGTASN